MKRKWINRTAGIVLTAAMLFTSQSVVWALGTQEEGIIEEGIIEEDDNVVIEDNDKPYLALGADLKAEEQKKVLSLLGIADKDLSEYDVVYVNNSEEHEYLDAYISSKEIGTRSLSSVVIMEAKEGSGVNISTHNINYCTAGMYKNAVATAGIADADIIVAGPFPLSGTAALVGIFKAYEEMTGEKLDDDAVDVAMDELVTTGELVEDIDGDSTDVEAMVAVLKEKIANGELENEEEIVEAIQQAASDYDLQLSDENVQDLKELLVKMNDLDIDWSNVIDQASDWAKKLDEKFGDSIKDAVTSEGFWDKIAGFFKKLMDALRSMFD